MPGLQGSLDELPTRNGFRLRGLASTRIETLTDAAFAFALTLLVVSLDVPTSYAELVDALRGIPAFALSAALLLMFWSGHHTWSRRYGLDDTPTVLLSGLLVFTVLVYVYPLRFVFQSMSAYFGYLAGVDLGGRSLTIEANQVNHLFVIYGAGFCAMCATLVLLNLHAWRRRDELGLDPVERFDTRAEIAAWTLVGSAGLLSIAVALFVPARWAGLPGWCYSLLGIVMPLVGRRNSRRRLEIHR
ncbi:MAG: TMEM175 family protein [Thermoanaerobaculia bacterium]